MRWSVGLLTAVALTGCAGNGDSRPSSDSGPSETAVGSTVDDGSTERVDVDPSRAGSAAPTASESTEQLAGSVEVTVRADGIDETFTGTTSASADPFGEFVSCSGLRSGFTVYSVLASRSEGAVRAVAVTTIGSVTGPGVFDASVRVERASGPAVDAVGTVTLDDGLAGGEFTAVDSTGGVVGGTFECIGGVADPAPFDEATADGSLVVEVSALLRSDGAERLVGLVASEANSAVVECPGSGDDEIVVVEGDATIGSISSFELFGGAAPALRMQVGTATYDVVDLTLGAADDDGAGSFGGSSLGVSVDGAYRCS